MDLIFHFHDSEISTVQVEVGRCVVKFAAAHVRQGVTNDVSYLSGLSIILDTVSELKQDTGCVGRLHDGALVVSGVRQRMAQLPCGPLGPLSIELSFSNGSEFYCQAQRCVFLIEDATHIHESYKC